jgi:long-chain acyl-CoA synthetase
VKTEEEVRSADHDPYASRPWVAEYPPDVPPSLDYPRQTTWEALEEIVSVYGDHDAYVFQDQALTFRQVMRYADRMAAALARVGVKRGDVVLLVLPNMPHFPVAYFGALKLGAAIAATPPLSTEREFEYFIRDSGAKKIVTIDLLYEKVANVWERAGIEQVIVGTPIDFMPFHVRTMAALLRKVPKPPKAVPYGERVVPMRSFLSSGRSPVPQQADPDDVAVLQYTGGTTGIPKAATLTHMNLLSNARQTVAWMPKLVLGQETMMAVLPLFHVYGMTLVMNSALLLGARTVLIPNWIPSQVFEAIKKYRPSIFPGVPTLYVAFVNDERSKSYDVSSIEWCFSGGAPLPVEVKRDFQALTQGHLFEGYGLSETSPVVSAQPYDGRGELGTIGLPIPDTEVRIVHSDTGRIMPIGESGELTVRGPQVMKGYWQRPEETADVLKDGWLFTGDVARMDERGWFFIVDRKKDLIITGGENVYPREIEEVLYEHPKVKEAAVVGVPHPFGGEVAKAFIVLREGETATKPEIVKFTGERLAKHKVPRSVEFRESLPKSNTGKVLRRVLQDEERAKAAAKPRKSRRSSETPAEDSRQS